MNDAEYKPVQPYHFTDAVSDNAVKFINEHDRSKPFFMYVAYTAAHWPMHARPRDIKKYDGMYDEGYQPIREARLKKMIKLGLIAEDTEMTPLVGDWDAVEDKEWESATERVRRDVVLAPYLPVVVGQAAGTFGYLSPAHALGRRPHVGRHHGT